jgi:hypothetical protein
MKVVTMVIAVAASATVIASAATAGRTTMEKSPAVISAAPQTTTAVRVPNVVGRRLDIGIFLLRRAGLRVPALGRPGEPECDGLFGCIVYSRWVVCEQFPRRSRLVPRGTKVQLFASRPGRC